MRECEAPAERSCTPLPWKSLIGERWPALGRSLGLPRTFRDRVKPSGLPRIDSERVGKSHRKTELATHKHKLTLIGTIPRRRSADRSSNRCRPRPDGESITRLICVYLCSSVAMMFSSVARAADGLESRS